MMGHTRTSSAAKAFGGDACLWMRARANHSSFCLRVYAIDSVCFRLQYSLEKTVSSVYAIQYHFLILLATSVFFPVLCYLSSFYCIVSRLNVYVEHD